MAMASILTLLVEDACRAGTFVPSFLSSRWWSFWRHLTTGTVAPLPDGPSHRNQNCYIHSTMLAVKSQRATQRPYGQTLRQRHSCGVILGLSSAGWSFAPVQERIRLRLVPNARQNVCNSMMSIRRSPRSHLLTNVCVSPIFWANCACVRPACCRAFRRSFRKAA